MRHLLPILIFALVACSDAPDSSNTGADLGGEQKECANIGGNMMASFEPEPGLPVIAVCDAVKCMAPTVWSLLGDELRVTCLDGQTVVVKWF